MYNIFIYETFYKLIVLIFVYELHNIYKSE